MIGGVTRRGLPHLPGAPHLHVNRPWGLVLVVFLSISLTVQNGNLQSWSLPFFTCFSWLSIRWARRVGRIQVTESFQKSTFPNRRLNANGATTVCPCRFSVMIFVDSLWCGRRSPHLLQSWRVRLHYLVDLAMSTWRQWRRRAENYKPAWPMVVKGIEHQK